MGEGQLLYQLALLDGRVLPNARAKRQTHALRDRTHDLARHARTKPDRALCHMRLDADVKVRIYTDLTLNLLNTLCMI